LSVDDEDGSSSLQVTHCNWSSLAGVRTGWATFCVGDQMTESSATASSVRLQVNSPFFRHTS
jgi:hypothetical protein